MTNLHETGLEASAQAHGRRSHWRYFWPRSLQYRVLLTFFLGSMAVTALSGWVVFHLLSSFAQQEYDGRLADKLRFYETVPVIGEYGDVVLRMGEASYDWEKLSDPKDPTYTQVTTRNGEKVHKYPFSSSKDKLPGVGEGSTEKKFVSLTLPDGTPARAAGSTLFLLWDPPDNQPAKRVGLNVVVAQSTKSVDDIRSRLVRLIVQSASVAIGLLLLVATFIIRRGVRSVTRLERQISELPVTEKGGRFSLPGAPSEVQTVVNRLNELMNRVDDALEHERTFTSNAAHELRTPLAGMRTQIELALSRTRTISEYEETLLSIGDIQLKLQQLVDNLLLLARLESGQVEFSKAPSNLKDLFKSAWKPFFNPAAEKEISFSMPIAKEQPSYVFPTALLGIVMRNLLQNAIDYTPRGGRIVLTGGVDPATMLCRLYFRNTNPGLDPETADRVFQPFWRADKSGDPNQHNAGIGLALSKRILGILEGDIRVAVTAEDMVEFTLEFAVEACQEANLLAASA